MVRFTVDVKLWFKAGMYECIFTFLATAVFRGSCQKSKDALILLAMKRIAEVLVHKAFADAV